MANKNTKTFPMDGVTPTPSMSAEEAALSATKVVEKEVVEDVAKKETEDKSHVSPVYWIPFGVTSFQEIEQFEQAKEAAFEIAEKSNLFPQLVENIMADESISDKSAAVSRISSEFGDFVKAKTDKIVEEDESKEKTSETSWLKKTDKKIDKVINQFTSKLSNAFGIKENTLDIPGNEKNGLVIWKQNGQYKFLAIYSNNYRDIETEIISAKSHELFVEKVDNGEYPMPTLRHFHIPGTEWGQAEMVHYDKESGFAIASGYILEGHENEAKAIMKMDNIAMSHGMLKSSVKRDPNDNNIIVEHQTVEISDLPLEDAANKLTNFHIIKEMDDMKTLPLNKVKYLESVGITDLSGLEKSLAKGKTLAESLDLDSKEASNEEVAPVAVPAEKPAAEEVAPTSEPVVDEPAVVETPAVESAGVADANVSAFSEEQTKQLQEAFATVADRIIERVEKSIDEKIAPVLLQTEQIKKEKDEFNKEILGQTPLVALQDAILSPDFLKENSASNSLDTLIDGRSALAKSGPVEKELNKSRMILNSGNVLADNLAGDIVSGDFLQSLKAPKDTNKVPA